MFEVFKNNLFKCLFLGFIAVSSFYLPNLSASAPTGDEIAFRDRGFRGTPGNRGYYSDNYGRFGGYRHSVYGNYGYNTYDNPRFFNRDRGFNNRGYGGGGCSDCGCCGLFGGLFNW